MNESIGKTLDTIDTLPICYVLILNYQSYQDTIQYVGNLKEQKNISLKILIIDNCSPNNSFEFLRDAFLDDDYVTVIKSEKNGGYAYGNNYGLRFLESVKTDYVVISNNDVVLNDENLIFKLISEYEKLPDVGFIAPLMHVNGKRSRYPAWKIPKVQDDLIGSSIILEKIFGNRTRYNIDNFSSTMKVECLPGSFFLGSKKIFFEIDLMDEGTFLYMEEAILACKVKQRDLKNYLIGSLNYEHLTAQTISSQMNYVKMNNYLLNSRIYFHRKYSGANKLEIAFFRFLFHVWRIENFMLTRLKKIF